MYSLLQDKSFMICGYVARDAETKTTQNGGTFTSWSVAVAKKPGEDGKMRSVYTNCKAFDKAAETAAAIRKGDTVLCIGRLETNEYGGRTYKNLMCEFVCIMGRSAPPPQPAPDVDAASDLQEFEEILSDGDLPF